MDIKKYEVLLKVIERGGLNQASEELGYSRSALSKIIGSIENEVGFPLVIRSSKGIALNNEGMRVLPYIRQLVKLNENLEDEYTMIKGEETGKIRIGCFPTCAYLFMPDIIKGFNDEHPGVTLEVMEENNLRMLENWLKKDVIDIAMFSREDYHGYGWITLLTEPYVGVFPEGHILTEKETVSVEEMCSHDLILFKNQSGYDQDMVKFLDKLDNTDSFRYFTNSIYLVTQMVEKYGCLSIVPLSFAKEVACSYPIEYRKLDTEVSREIGFAVKDENSISPMVRKFYQYARKTVKNI